MEVATRRYYFNFAEPQIGWHRLDFNSAVAVVNRAERRVGGVVYSIRCTLPQNCFEAPAPGDVLETQRLENQQEVSDPTA